MTAAPLQQRLGSLGPFRRLPTHVQLLLATQLLFNVGFFMVLPYLAGYLDGELRLPGTIVGFVLGLRTFSQQGMFVVGGTLSDRFGPKPIILVGIAIRIVGFVLLGVSWSLGTALVAVILIGFAAALFSPSVESSIARAAGEIEQAGGPPRTALIAMNSVSLQLGAVLGPLVGALLLLINFRVSCLVAALVFVGIWLAYLTLFPSFDPIHRSDPIIAGWGEVLGNKVYLFFALGYSGYLVSYNQMYLALPAELTRSMGNDKALGVLMAIGSIMVIVGQIPLTHWARPRLGARQAIPLGFVSIAMAFAVVGLASLLPPARGLLGLWSGVGMIVLLTLGQMLAAPFAADLVAKLANERRLGAHYGFLNSCGGTAVLGGSTLVGALLSKETHGLRVATPWLTLTGLAMTSAVLVGGLMIWKGLGQPVSNTTVIQASPATQNEKCP